MPRSRSVLLVAASCLVVALLSGCTPSDKTAVRLDPSGPALEIATCEKISINLVRVEQFDAESSEWVPAWIAVGEHEFRVGDRIAVGQPIEGMEVKIDRPLDFTEDGAMSVSLELWRDSDLESVDDSYQFDGHPLKLIGFSFELSELGNQWLRGDNTSHESPCPTDS